MDFIADAIASGELEWSEGEPAINVYSGGGGFGPHADHMALTIIVPLTAPAQAQQQRHRIPICEHVAAWLDLTPTSRCRTSTAAARASGRRAKLRAAP